jgi:hypothetical protein
VLDDAVVSGAVRIFSQSTLTDSAKEVMSEFKTGRLPSIMKLFPQHWPSAISRLQLIPARVHCHHDDRLLIWIRLSYRTLLDTKVKLANPSDAEELGYGMFLFFEGKIYSVTHIILMASKLPRLRRVNAKKRTRKTAVRFEVDTAAMEIAQAQYNQIGLDASPSSRGSLVRLPTLHLPG